MKKFLSLVLALVMTMSLVTISAGATEYKDLTDKDEIQYEEAVAVLNRIGIITGYSDGSFQPKTELTRGAAAKIIVSLLIGTEAANNLVASAAPYTDVPVDHTFAGVISFCKTSKIIDGYQDGSFKPAGTLSGYAFAKMLLGALGYKSELEGFTGAGWTMNVARLGNAAGLFDRLSFKGNETVNREQACQLALNTLKATTVEYTGGLTVTAGDASVVGGQVRSYVTSNNRDFALNISARSVEDGWWTVEFGEEHFVDLRLEHDKRNPTDNDLGQPSAEWSYKKVTIGTYALEPDFRYTELVAHNDNSSTDASKVRALGLSGYEVDNGTQLWLNGYASTTKLGKVANIANYTDNGTVVEVYVSETNADYITDVVVIQSALVEVKRVGSDYVTIGKYDTDGSDTFRASNGTDIKYEGYNRDSFDVVKTDGLVASKAYNDIQVEDRGYDVLSGLKAGDKAVVVPVAEDHGNANFDVWEAYVPETVTGALTRVDTYGSNADNRGAIGLTVGGTAYKAAEWNKDIIGIKGEDIKVTKKDVTLTLDKYGNALLAEDVGATKEYMIVGNYYESLVDGRIVDFVHGWDVDGNEVDLNLGRDGELTTARPGDLVQYVSNSSGSAEWVLKDGKSTGNPGKIYNVDHNANGGNYQVTAYNTKIALTDAGSIAANSDVTLSGSTLVDFASGIKFIYVEFNSDNEVESVEIRKGVQAASNQELRAWRNGVVDTGANYYGPSFKGSAEWNTAEAYVSGKTADGNVAVKAVVIKRESNTAISSNLLYIRDYLGSAQKSDGTGKIIYGYTVVMNTADGLAGEAKTIYSYENLDVGDFASYTEVQNDQVSDFYKLREHTSHFNKTTTTFVAEVQEILKSNDSIIVLKGDSYKAPNKNSSGNYNVDEDDPSTKPAVGTISYAESSDGKQIGEYVNRVRVNSRTQWVDLTTNHIASTKDLKDFENIKLAMVVNDNVESDGFRDVSMIIVQHADRVAGGGSSGGGDSTGNARVTSVTRASNGAAKVEFSVTKPSWAAGNGVARAYVLVDGVETGDYAQANFTDSGTYTELSNGYYPVGTDLSCEDVEMHWDAVKATAAAALPEGMTVASSVDVGTNSTFNVTFDDNAFTGTPAAVVKQNGQTLASSVTATDLANGTITVKVTGEVVEGYPVEVNITGLTATISVTVTPGTGWKVNSGNAVASEGDPITVILEQTADPTADTQNEDYDLKANNKMGITNLLPDDLTISTAVVSRKGTKAVAATYGSPITITGVTANAVDSTGWETLFGSTETTIYRKTTSGENVTYTPITKPTGTDTVDLSAAGDYVKQTDTAHDAVRAQVTITFTMPATSVSFTCTPNVAV